MPVATAPKEYKLLLKRQEKVEAELDILKKLMAMELDDQQIKPSVLRKWAKISRDLDAGKGRFFNSPEEARKWLKTI